MISKTLSPENQFLFTCPVFKANTKMSACMELRDRVWRGDQVPVRHGCQVAMHAGKCPIPVILTHMIRMKDDPYHSTEAKIGSIRQDVLDQIAPVLVNEKFIEASEATPQEKKALHQCNEDARAGTKMTTKSRPYVKPAAPTKTKLPEPVVPDATITAAATGDLSAAINQETTT